MIKLVMIGLAFIVCMGIIFISNMDDPTPRDRALIFLSGNWWKLDETQRQEIMERYDITMEEVEPGSILDKFKKD